jgi:hypothetical protein
MNSFFKQLVPIQLANHTFAIVNLFKFIQNLVKYKVNLDTYSCNEPFQKNYLLNYFLNILREN